MTADECARTLTVLPGWIRGELEGEEARRVEGHVVGCADCRADAELLRALARSRPEPPPELGERVRNALRAAAAEGGTDDGADRGEVWARRWGWEAILPRVAAVAALVLLTATVLLVPGADEAGHAGPELALESTPDVWLSDDGMVAGAPLLGELSDEELGILLEEMEP